MSRKYKIQDQVRQSEDCEYCRAQVNSALAFTQHLRQSGFIPHPFKANNKEFYKRMQIEINYNYRGEGSNVRTPIGRTPYGQFLIQQWEGSNGVFGFKINGNGTLNFMDRIPGTTNIAVWNSSANKMWAKLSLELRAIAYDRSN